MLLFSVILDKMMASTKANCCRHSGLSYHGFHINISGTGLVFGYGTVFLIF